MYFLQERPGRYWNYLEHQEPLQVDPYRPLPKLINHFLSPCSNLWQDSWHWPHPADSKQFSTHLLLWDVPKKMERDGFWRIWFAHVWWQKHEFKTVRESSTCKVSEIRIIVTNSDKLSSWNRIWIHWRRILPSSQCKNIRPPKGNVVKKLFL